MVYELMGREVDADVEVSIDETGFAPRGELATCLAARSLSNRNDHPCNQATHLHYVVEPVAEGSVSRRSTIRTRAPKAF